MSGIVGIISLDGSPIDQRLLESMTGFMDFRGPDSHRTWTHGQAGLGHTLLITTFEAAFEQQPCSLDGNVWITADARIDGRSDLISNLRGRGREIENTITDPELILHAYLSWDEKCLEHLIGDFAFAIWDVRKHSLFCARDHFGVKPFFYAQVGNQFIFSNTLNCLRQHPNVSDELNDLAIADFLLFSYIQDLDASSFKDIKRLPPAHQLSWKNAALQTRRYWSLPTDGHIRYRKDQDYIEHFRELFTNAVRDRVRTDRVAIAMSGGLDSASIAATVKNLSSVSGNSLDICAITSVYDHLIPDPEREFAAAVSGALSIRHDYLIADNYGLFDHSNSSIPLSPEPRDTPLPTFERDFQERLGEHSRVTLIGQGGDEVLFRECAVNLLGQVPLNELLRDLVNTLFSHRLRPAFGFRGQLDQWLKGGEQVSMEGFPPWLKPDFASQLNLGERYRHYLAVQLGSDFAAFPGSTRPSALRRLSSNRLSDHLETHDPGITGLPFEFRFPFLDIRLVSDLLVYPALPWFIDKALLRLAMKGGLPESVRLRPKTPMLADPVIERLYNGEYHWLDDFKAGLGLQEYVIRDRIPRVVTSQKSLVDPYSNLRPFNLNYWLENYTSAEHE